MTLLNNVPVYMSKYAPQGFAREIDGRWYMSPDMYYRLRQTIECHAGDPRLAGKAIYRTPTGWR